MKRTVPALLAILLVACSSERTDIISVTSEDAEMNTAMAEARRTVDTFWLQREKEQEAFEGLLKVYFTDEGSSEDGEHMWVRVTERSTPDLKGILLSEPGWLKSVRGGQEVSFSTEQISDWLCIEHGKAKGAYTVQLLRQRMTDQERREHDQGYPFRFE